MKFLQIIFVFLMAFASLALFMVLIYNGNIIAGLGSGVMWWLIKEYIELQDNPTPVGKGKVVPMYGYDNMVANVTRPKEEQVPLVKSNLTNVLTISHNTNPQAK